MAEAQRLMRDFSRIRVRESELDADLLRCGFQSPLAGTCPRRSMLFNAQTTSRQLLRCR